MHTLYLGPSWAVQSYESVQGLGDPIKTNLAIELELADYTLLAGYANSNFDQLSQAKIFMQTNKQLQPFNAVFVTANALQDGWKIYQKSQIEFAKDFLFANDPLDIVQDLEQKFYQQLQTLDIPVALIGAHTDVTCKSHNNITVIHPSWQNFLAQQCGLNSFYGWAADVAHRWLQGTVIPDHGPPVHFEMETQPSPAVVDLVHSMITVNWYQLEKNKLFVGNHPNILGNQLFAKEIADSFNKWVDNVV